jgi:hypothetical protein
MLPAQQKAGRQAGNQVQLDDSAKHEEKRPSRPDGQRAAHLRYLRGRLELSRDQT